MNETENRDFSSAGDRSVVRQLLARVRAQRLSRNWSQAEMARRAGLSRPSYQNFEGGFANITLANLVRILGVLGFSSRVGDLVPEVEEERTLQSAYRRSRQRARSRGGKK